MKTTFKALRPILTGTAIVTVLAGYPASASAVQDVSGYRIQVYAAVSPRLAEDVATRLRERLDRRHAVYVGPRGAYYAVRVGDFSSPRQADALMREVRRLGFDDAWIARNSPGATSKVILAGDAHAAIYDLPPGRWTPLAPPAIQPAPASPTANPPASLSASSPVLAETPANSTATAAVRVPAITMSAPPGATATTMSDAEPAALASNSTRNEIAGTKHMRAVRSHAQIRVDGRLDDEIWAGATFNTDFQQKGKDRGFEPAERTEVAVAFDDEALYVAARMHVSDRDQMRTLVSRRDDPGNVERLLVSLDTYRDRSTAYTFGVTMGGARLDYYQARDNEGWKDDSFDPVWDARVATDSAGWTAEMRIPYSQLRFDGAESPVWGLNIRRWNPATFLNLYWVVVPYYETGWSSRFGTLEGLDPLSGARRVEVVPYALASTVVPDVALRADGALRRNTTRGGGDIKVGLASNLTLDATFNPDFGQVEADPADVNLSAYETFFPEKRPFFLEGRELFRSRGPNLFYSRRIGSVPPGTTPGGALTSPANATILGAVKMTGRMGSGLSAGALAAVTAAEDARVAVPDGLGTSTVRVAPVSGFAVARLNQEIGSAGSNIGLMLTGVERSLASGTGLAGALTRRAFAGITDWNLRFGGGTWEISGYGGLSHVAGDVQAMRRVQTSSAHYFQRPDAPHIRFDSTRTSLSGWTAGASLSKYGGAHWFWDATVAAQSPGFEIRDAGSQASADRIDASAGMHYSQRGTRGLFKAYTIGAAVGTGWDFGGVRQYISPSVYTDLTWPNLWRSYVEVGVSPRATSSSLTRGGPLMGTPSSTRLAASLTSSTVPRTQWYANVEGFFDESGGWSSRVDAGVSMLPGERIRLSVNPGYSRASASRQYFTVIDSGPALTYGRRYVFSALDRTELYLQLRASLAITPDLTVELYGEPFAANARFHDFGELTAPGAYDIRRYGTYGSSTISRESDGSLSVTDADGSFTLGNGDFNIRSFRSNAVVRWEWLRGSTLFLVWQQNRWLYADRFNEIGPAALWQTIGDNGENILMAKLTYWLAF